MRPRSPGWADLAPSIRGLPGRRGSSCTGPESCPHPFSDLQSAPLTSLCATPEAGRDRLRREARPHLPHPTDELRPGGLGGSGEVGVWLGPQISFGLYSQHGGQEDFFQPHLHIPFPKHVWFLFCCICKRPALGAGDLPYTSRLTPLETDGARSRVIYSPSLRS